MVCVAHAVRRIRGSRISLLSVGHACSTRGSVGTAPKLVHSRARLHAHVRAGRESSVRIVAIVLGLAGAGFRARVSVPIETARRLGTWPYGFYGSYGDRADDSRKANPGDPDTASLAAERVTGDSERRPSRWPPWVGGKLRLLSRRPGAASEKCDTSEPCPRAIHGIYRGAARSISCRCSVNRRRKSGERGVNRAEEARLASQVSFKVSTWSTHGAWPRGSSRQASFRPWRRSFWSLFATWSNRAHRPPRAKLG